MFHKLETDVLSIQLKMDNSSSTVGLSSKTLANILELIKMMTGLKVNVASYFVHIYWIIYLLISLMLLSHI